MNTSASAWQDYSQYKTSDCKLLCFNIFRMGYFLILCAAFGWSRKAIHQKSNGTLFSSCSLLYKDISWSSFCHSITNLTVPEPQCTFAPVITLITLCFPSRYSDLFFHTLPQRSHKPKSVWDQFITFLNHVAVDEHSWSMCDHVQDTESDHASSIMHSCCWTRYSLVRPQTLNYSKIAQGWSIRGYFVEWVNRS